MAADARAVGEEGSWEPTDREARAPGSRVLGSARGRSRAKAKHTHPAARGDTCAAHLGPVAAHAAHVHARVKVSCARVNAVGQRSTLRHRGQAGQGSSRAPQAVAGPRQKSKAEQSKKKQKKAKQSSQARLASASAGRWGPARLLSLCGALLASGPTAHARQRAKALLSSFAFLMLCFFHSASPATNQSWTLLTGKGPCTLPCVSRWARNLISPAPYTASTLPFHVPPCLRVQVLPQHAKGRVAARGR